MKRSSLYPPFRFISSSLATFPARGIADSRALRFFFHFFPRSLATESRVETPRAIARKTVKEERPGLQRVSRDSSRSDREICLTCLSAYLIGLRQQAHEGVLRINIRVLYRESNNRTRESIMSEASRDLRRFVKFESKISPICTLVGIDEIFRRGSRSISARFILK